jgi:hypothetical protein
MMLIASVIGALAGVYYSIVVNPLNNYFVFMALFAMVGVGVANVVLLVLYGIYEWVEQ